MAVSAWSSALFDESFHEPPPENVLTNYRPSMRFHKSVESRPCVNEVLKERSAPSTADQKQQSSRSPSPPFLRQFSVLQRPLNLHSTNVGSGSVYAFRIPAAISDRSRSALDRVWPISVVRRRRSNPRQSVSEVRRRTGHVREKIGKASIARCTFLSFGSAGWATARRTVGTRVISSPHVEQFPMKVIGSQPVGNQVLL